MGVFAGGEWEPQNPEAAVQSTATLSRNADGGGDGWVVPPPSSHVERFAWKPASGSPLNKYLISPDEARRFKLNPNRVSVLTVIFKDKGKGRWGYHYYFANEPDGEFVFNLMTQTDSPWSVGDKYLKKAGIPHLKYVEG